MVMRITGLTSGLDVDSIVTDSLKPYKLKIQAQEQQKQILEWKQTQYQSIMKKANTFYNKYLDSTSKDSLYSMKNYNQTKFTSSSSAVTVTSSSSSSIQNYSVAVSQVATKSSGTINKASLTEGNQIEINGQKFALRGSSNSEIARNLTEDIGTYNSKQSDSSKQINVTAKYSDLANNGSGGLTIENKSAGSTPPLTISVAQSYDSETSATAATTNGYYSATIEKANLKAGSTITIGSSSPILLEGDTEQEIVDNLNTKLSGTNVTASYDPDKGIMTLKANNLGDGDTNKFTAVLKDGDKETNLTVDIDGKYESIVNQSSLNDNSAIKINGRTFRVSYKDGKIDTDDLSVQLKDAGLSVEAKLNDSNDLVLTSKNSGVSSKFETSIVTYATDTSGTNLAKSGTDLEAAISDENGNLIAIKNGKIYDKDGNEVINSSIKINENSVIFDGNTFKFNSASSDVISVTGSQDVSELKDKIVSFMNDYNELMGEINGKLWENYNSDYLPLTDDQREAMSDKQIEQWETKAQTGLLRRDDDLRTLADNMKNVMSSLMSSTGLSLERIGIKPVNDYKELNGTFEIDEDKLTTALQNNFDDVKDLFTKGYLDDNTSNAGIIPKMRELINNNFVKFDSVFNKKAATSGVYALTNEMTKQITEKKSLIAQMNKDLNNRQEALYSKYSALETAMAKAQSQQASMSSWFGTSS